LRHTTYWYEKKIKDEWPLSANAAEEEAPRDDEPFDYNAKPQKFYFEVETDGSLRPQEVVMKVPSSSHSFVRDNDAKKKLNNYHITGSHRTADEARKPRSRTQIGPN
jgi:hypothetical protein